MNLRYFAEELLAQCDELDELRARCKRLEAENEAFRKDQYETFIEGRKTVANWLAFAMDKRVTIDLTAPK